MTTIFVDESIHEAAGFIVVSFVITSSDAHALVCRHLTRLGYKPGVDEFKSNQQMDGDRRRRILREALSTVLQRHCSLAFLVTSSAARPKLGTHVFTALAALVEPRGVPQDGLRVYVDEGIDPPPILPPVLDEPVSEGSIVLHPHSDSRAVGGVQLADLAAHRCAVMLLGALGHNTKLVKAGPRSGYDPDTEFSIGSTMWAELRWLLLHGGHPPAAEIASDGHYVTVEGYGLFFGDSCPPEVVAAARATIGRCYLGCIH